MREVTLPQLVKALQAVGVKAGDGLLVPTESAIEILESPIYSIECTKIKHVVQSS